MDWKKAVILASCLALVSACGPSGVIDSTTGTDTDTDGDSMGTGSGSSGGGTSASDPTAGSMSGGAATTESTTDPSVGDSSGPAEGSGSDTTDPGTASGDTGDCPVGAEGCLCDVGASCDEGLLCNLDDGTCVGPPACRPIDEDPHDDEGSAIGFEDLGCNDGTDLGVIGTIEGPQTDWYTYFGNDAFMCPEQPGAVVMADEPLAVCVYLECANGDEVSTIACAGDGTDAMSPDGRPGCCGVDDAVVEGYDCAGFGGKDVDVYISVASEDEVCVDYGLVYSF